MVGPGKVAVAHTGTIFKWVKRLAATVAAASSRRRAAQIGGIMSDLTQSDVIFN